MKNCRSVCVTNLKFAEKDFCGSSMNLLSEGDILHLVNEPIHVDRTK